VDRHQAGAEGRGGRLAAEQQQKAEESGNELEKQNIETLKVYFFLN
jgi:hypothetical protein